MKGHDFFIIGPGELLGQHRVNPSWTDPAKYPGAELIEDDESILRIAEIEKLVEREMEVQEEIMRLQEQAGIIRADKEAQKARLFPAMRRNHHGVITAEMTSFGWRKHDGKYYCVAWDEETVKQFLKEQGRGGGAEEGS